MNVDFNRNPTGKNQHARRSAEDQQRLENALRKYHREKIDSNTKIADRLKAEENIDISVANIKRLRTGLGLHGSRSKAAKAALGLDTTNASQAILNQLSTDISRRSGVRTIQAKVAYSTGTHLPRHFVSDVMHTHEPGGFAIREPTAKRIFRVPKDPIGIHHRWAGDGHDKLYKIGFPIYAVVDDATNKCLGAWVLPSNRMGVIVAYTFLCLVEQYGGMPVQFTSDSGSETTVLYGIISSLRNHLYPEVPVDEIPAHVFVRSIHNISIERSWLRLRLDFGDNAVLWFNRGLEDGTYQPDDEKHFELCQWLWSRLLKQELNTTITIRNGIRMRKDKKKLGPSGMSRNDAFALYEQWGGQDYLMPVDVELVRRLKASMGGDELLEFCSREYRQKAQLAYDSLHIISLTFQNVWGIFKAMLRKLEDQ